MKNTDGKSTAAMTSACLMVLLAIVGCSMTQRRFYVYSAHCPDGKSVVCQFEADSIDVRVLVHSWDGVLIGLDHVLINRRADTLQYDLKEITAWENGNELERVSGFGINGISWADQLFANVGRDTLTISIAFKRRVEKDSKGGAIVFKLGSLYSGTTYVSNLGDFSISLSGFEKTKHKVVLGNPLKEAR